MKVVEITPQEWLDGLVGASEKAELRQARVQVSDSRELDLYTLIAGWYQHVRKMRADLPLPDEDRSVWGVHDLLAALSLRDFVERGTGQLEAGLAETAGRATGIADEEFLAYTEKDDSRIMEIVDDSITVGSEWWWERVPVSGPIRREIDAIRGRLTE